MPHLKLIRLIGAVVVLAGMPLLAASAQTPAPTAPAPGASPPAATTPDAPPTAPMTKPANPSESPATAPRRPDKSATAPGRVNSLVGLAVFSSDGNKMGTVHSVSSAPDGSVKAIHIKTGGFLGFGGKLVAIPEGRFAKSGENIQLGMSADEVSKLPAIKEQS
jgi:PRC-barrel domain protein